MILLTGATGFVGSHMVEALRAAGQPVRCLVRSREKATQQGLSAAERVEGDILRPETLPAACAGIEKVIHLVGIILERGQQTFERVHYQGTGNVVAAAKQAGVKRFVHMSALGARSDPRATAYHRTKWKAEQEVINSGIPYVILRPAIIYGPRDGFVTQMVDMIEKAPVIPIVGTGEYPLQPIFINNVCQAFVGALTNEKATNKILELGGPEALAYEKVIDAIAAAIGVNKKKIHLPFPFMRLNAAVLETFLPLVGATPPVTRAQLQMLREGSTCDVRPALETFHLRLVPFTQGLASYLKP
ncbi:MAG: SDR family oxidoreductase [Terriglobia bacterium]